MFGRFLLIVVIKLHVFLCLKIIDCKYDDLERNIKTLTGTLGCEIVWFVLSQFWLIVVMKLRVSGVFSSIQ